MKIEYVIKFHYWKLIVFSCSNDTTIKLWSLSKTYNTLKDDNEIRKINSISTLNDDIDYVRAIDFSSYNSSLYSACDNGIVR